jgi:F-type H+/Na+-transporting ATPase subunit alpha
VAVIYAVTNGYLDAVPVERVGSWERGFLEFLEAQHGEFLDRIRTEKALSEDLERILKSALQDFGARFAAEAEAAS